MVEERDSNFKECTYLQGLSHSLLMTYDESLIKNSYSLMGLTIKDRLNEEIKGAMAPLNFNCYIYSILKFEQNKNSIFTLELLK